MLEDIFELSSPADYGKMFINIKNSNENKEIVTEIENRISDLKDKLKEMSETEKKQKKNKSVDEALKIIEKILNYNKNAQTFFLLASKVDKGKSELKKKKTRTKN